VWFLSTAASRVRHYARIMAKVLTVNLAYPRPNPDEKAGGTTGIDKRPTDGAVAVRAPGPMAGCLGSGLVGDTIGNHRIHGGDDQAVYAFAREDLDTWQAAMRRELGNGVFGENVTTSGVDITNARIGELWRVGSDGLRLEISRPRIPCRTFAQWLSVRGWTKTFTGAAMPGAYLRVVEPGTMRAGDDIEVVDRPGHSVTIGVVFRALTTEPELLPLLLEAEALTDALKERARRRV